MASYRLILNRVVGSLVILLGCAIIVLGVYQIMAQPLWLRIPALLIQFPLAFWLADGAGAVRKWRRVRRIRQIWK
jgi:hypothetical protein